MTFGQFLSILRARWWVVALVLGLTVATTLLVSLLLPRQYTATASVVVDFKPDPVSAFAFGGGASPAYMATQVDIIRSERVAQRVVRNLKLNENPQVRQQWLDETGGEGNIEVWLASVFQKQMDVVPSRESSVIAVSYKAPDPRFAAGLANAFAQAYIDTALELRTDPARLYSTFFENRAKEARETLEKAQSKVSAFQKQAGIIATDERLDVETARLNELSSQATMMQALLAESASRQAQAQGGQGDRMQEVLNNANVSQLKADISRAEAQLQQLATRLGDKHPQVEEAKASLAELRSRLEAETRKVTGSVTVSANINRQRLGEVQRALQAQRDKVLKMKAVRDEGLVLLRDAENAQRSYDALLQRFTQTSLEGQTTQSNINLLTQATPPLEPSSPRIVLNTLLSIFLGTLLAVGTALLLELKDRRVRNVDDVVEALGLPVLGLMPKPGTQLQLGAGRVSPMQQRLMAPLPQSTQGA
ncbi:MAG: chain length determinant protein EpsF [Rubrivivax sp.]|jgi:chain length determinant protein EpsF|nr:chain length determinant protein EpsF [Betaproteobacteria bacterium]MBP6320423.1 chain length determinant protein EpsF [Rubrivivax sp.]MBP6465661.1 chain length determinant protein EpsF [Rubrivivax sp.]